MSKSKEYVELDTRFLEIRYRTFDARNKLPYERFLNNALSMLQVSSKAEIPKPMIEKAVQIAIASRNKDALDKLWKAENQNSLDPELLKKKSELEGLLKLLPSKNIENSEDIDRNKLQEAITLAEELKDITALGVLWEIESLTDAAYKLEVNKHLEERLREFNALEDIFEIDCDVLNSAIYFATFVQNFKLLNKFLDIREQIWTVAFEDEEISAYSAGRQFSSAYEMTRTLNLIKKNKSIISLEINRALNNEELYALSEVVQNKVKPLEKLCWNGRASNVSTDAIHTFGQALKSNTSLKVFEFNQKVKPEFYNQIILPLQENHTLDTLHLGGGRRFGAMSSTQALMFGRNTGDMEDDVIKSVAKILKKNRSIKCLIFEGGMSFRAVKHLSRALKENRFLLKLYLKDITPKAALYLARALVINRTLRYLRVDWDTGVSLASQSKAKRRIWDGLKYNATLQTCILESPSVTLSDEIAEARMLKKNRTILFPSKWFEGSSLDIRGDEIPEYRQKWRWAWETAAFLLNLKHKIDATLPTELSTRIKTFLAPSDMINPRDLRKIRAKYRIWTSLIANNVVYLNELVDFMTHRPLTIITDYLGLPGGLKLRSDSIKVLISLMIEPYSTSIALDRLNYILRRRQNWGFTLTREEQEMFQVVKFHELRAEPAKAPLIFRSVDSTKKQQEFKKAAHSNEPERQPKKKPILTPL